VTIGREMWILYVHLYMHRLSFVTDTVI